ncbi:MAG: hypothetical protein PHG67_05135 [Bacteroidales bacterium]|jgi:hypothetical protein|nr:hypothetical protein [Bacteroidales bacterium]HOI32716.1 hypothetical protein [Bacteroidales bacterium]
MPSIFEKQVAKLLSVIFHPLLIPVWAYLALIWRADLIMLRIPYTMIWKLAGLVFITTFLFPLSIILLMLKFKLISSLQMPSRQERIAPLLVTAVFFYLTFYLLKHLQIAPVLYVYMLGATLLAIIASAINLWWKISLHMIGLGAITGAFTGLALLSPGSFYLLLILSVLISGLVGAARLILLAHKPIEVYTGFFTGYLLMLNIFLWIGN